MRKNWSLAAANPSPKLDAEWLSLGGGSPCSIGSLYFLAKRYNPDGLIDLLKRHGETGLFSRSATSYSDRDLAGLLLGLIPQTFAFTVLSGSKSDSWFYMLAETGV